MMSHLIADAIKCDINYSTPCATTAGICCTWSNRWEKMVLTDAMAKMLGVSRIVTKEAFRRVAAEGLLASRERLGTFVRDTSEKRWRGRRHAPRNGRQRRLRTVHRSVAAAHRGRCQGHGRHHRGFDPFLPQRRRMRATRWSAAKVTGPKSPLSRLSLSNGRCHLS